MHEMFERSASVYRTQNCLGYRPYNAESSSYGPYSWISYSAAAERRKNFGAGLMKTHQDICGSLPQGGVGLWCNNRPEWQIVDLGCMSQSLFTVSIYETLGVQATEYIINQAALSVVCASADHVEKLQSLAPRCPSLKFLVIMDDVIPELNADTSMTDASGRLPVFSLKHMEDVGKHNPRSFQPPSPDTIITINYTSGTTGMPKGVVLTHKAAVAAASCAMSIVDLREGDRICSFLPLAHIFERAIEGASLWAGTSIGYYHGNVQALVDDLKALQPTNMINVPRVYSRFAAGMKAKTAQAAGSMDLTNKDTLSFLHGQISKGLGLDCCRIMISGSAPIDPLLQSYLRDSLKNTFKQGYGLTETYAITLAQDASDESVGTCGAVLPAVEVCLQDAQDFGYMTTDQPNPRGELLIRSNTLFSGYYLNPAATAESFTEDGWFCSGDICEIDDLGRVRVVDRRKNILKLAQGEYVSPERIENILHGELPWVSQIMVHGDSDKSYLVAIIGVERASFAKMFNTLREDSPVSSSRKDSMVVEDDFFSGLHDERVIAAAMNEIRKAEISRNMNGLERVKAIALLEEPFSIENGSLTPTLKLKRHEAAKTYRTLIDQIEMMRLKMKTLWGSIESELKDHYPSGVEMDFVDGPVDLLGDLDETSPIRLNAWWRALDDRSRYVELEASLTGIFTQLRERPVDAIIGFSQGAALAVMIAAILENTVERRAAIAKQGSPFLFPSIPQQPLKFVIAYSGFKGSPAFYSGFYEPKLSTPVLHILARLDHMIAPEDSAKLIRSCRNSEVAEHLGGHWIPRDPGMVSLVSTFIRRACRDTRRTDSFCEPK
ncbi:acetyl-CoA synthetase-like protein, partial [Aureobasidium melanogenum]